MIPLIIDQKAIDDLKRLRSYAENNPYSMDDLLDMQNRQLDVPGDNPNNTVFLNFGFKVVFSTENHIMGSFKRLSMSVQTTNNRVPSIQAVELVMQHLGFTKNLKDCIVKLQEFTENFSYVEVIQEVN